MSESKVNPADRPEKEVASLLGGEDFKGFLIKEWSFGQLVQISPVLEAMADGVQRRGISWDQFAAIFDEPKEKKRGESQGESQGIGFGEGFKIVAAILPQMPMFLSISLGIEIEEINKVSAPLAGTLALKIIGKNLEHISSFFGDLVKEIAGLTATAKVGIHSTAGSRSQDS